ncbi:iron-sulfur cluster biosynthesis family protein [Lactiplantibacillus sp. WILCCON 0030]|uniref:Iron-sulfur cluster biosynthesis family protein n=1 Tax=Lactiplantibacillus brownii TaxID=3069269 RepID=A0ABU1ABQ5_9LACO|nr:iron-sulfur cluster biosynthesis family protein [Lactiplantibacillus brownii]MDQ7938350.1 iron-sulfur cluster biosynthesis family protein [Lactiplantibacillus brownii]
MTTIKLSEAFVDLLQRKQLTNKNLVLLTDDGGGKYSLHGGACTIGTKFTIIVLDQPDADYPVQLTNTAGIQLWTSAYDLMFLTAGITLDYGQGRISIKDDAHILDQGVQIADGKAVLAAFEQGVAADGKSC